jgi:hypothetical protein
MFWDRGPDALSAFVAGHVCNSLCDYLELDDLRGFNISQITERVKGASQATENNGATRSPGGCAENGSGTS